MLWHQAEGLCRDIQVTATGSGIKVPVGDGNLEGCLTF